MPAPKPCSVPGCIKPSRKRTWCGAHYTRWRVYGDVGGATIKTHPPRGLDHYELMLHNGWDFTDTGCWEYKGPRFAQVKAQGTNPLLGHRVSYEHHHGPIPEGMMVRHKCDNPPCVNPNHLEVGTHQDNMNDRDERGRTARGDRHWKRKHLAPTNGAD